MRNWLYVMTLAAGFALTVQVGLNAMVRQATGNASFASLVNFGVGTLALAVFLLATRFDWPARATLAGLPAWAWLGGCLGAFYVATATLAGSTLGGTLLLALTVAGQLLAALVFDHFGWLGFPQQPITALKLVGVAFLIVGIWLIAR